MTGDGTRAQTIEELRIALRQQQAALSEQAQRVAALERALDTSAGQRPRGDDRPARHEHRVSRGKLLKTAAMGAIGLVGAEVGNTLGAPSASAATDVGHAPTYTADGIFNPNIGSYDGGIGFTAPSIAHFDTGGTFYGNVGVLADGYNTGISAASTTGHAVQASVVTLYDNGAVILAQITTSQSVGANASAVRGQVDKADSSGIGVFGSHAGSGIAGYFTAVGGTGVHGDSGGPYPAIYGNCTGTGPSVFGDSSATGDGASGRSAGGNGVAGYSGSPAHPGQGYGGRFGISSDALAQLYLAPAGTGGHPTTGTHLIGEMFMDPGGNLYIFTSSGWQRVQTAISPTDARITHFSVRRTGERSTFLWRMADGKGVAGFEVYAAGRRLNRQTIRPHRARTYKVRTAGHVSGPFTLHVLLYNGQVIVVHAEGHVRD